MAVDTSLEERLRAGYSAWNRTGEVDALRGMEDVWRGITFAPVEVRIDAAGRRALVVVRVSTTGRSSDLGLEATEGHVHTFGQDGKVVRIQAFNELEQARAAFEAI